MAVDRLARKLALGSAGRIRVAPGSFGAVGSSETAENNYTRLQAMLTEAARQTRTGAREVVFNADGFVPLSAALVMPNNVRLIVTGNGRFVPSSALLNGIRTIAADPTSYTALAVDALRYADSVQIASTAGFAIGNIVFLRSSATLPDTGTGTFNSGGGTVGTVPVKCGQVLRVIGKTSTLLYFDAALEYDFLTSDTAEIAVVTGASDNVRIEGFRWGDPEDYASRGVLPGNGILFTYGMDLAIIGASVWNRLPGGADNAGCLGVAFNHVVGGRIEAEYIHSGYYGATVNGACRNVQIIGGRYHRCRHATSMNWTQLYGEPVDTLVERVEATQSVISSFDCHDVGRRLTYRRCIGKGSGDDIFQVRSADVRIEDCYAAGAPNDAIGPEASALRLRIKNLTMRNNGFGIRAARADIDVDGVDAWDCGTVSGLWHVSGGSWRNLRAHSGNSNQVGIIRKHANYVDGTRLVVDGLYAPYEAGKQTILFSGFTDLSGFDIRNLDLPGWLTASQVNLFRGSVAGPAPASPSIRGMRVATTAAPLEGEVALVAGVATVTTANAYNYAGNSSGAASPPLRSNINVIRVVSAGTPGANVLVTAINNGVGFTITSRKADGTTETADTSTIKWKIL